MSPLRTPKAARPLGSVERSECSDQERSKCSGKIRSPSLSRPYLRPRPHSTSWDPHRSAQYRSPFIEDVNPVFPPGPVESLYLSCAPRETGSQWITQLPSCHSRVARVCDALSDRRDVDPFQQIPYNEFRFAKTRLMFQQADSHGRAVMMGGALSDRYVSITRNQPEPVQFCSWCSSQTVPSWHHLCWECPSASIDRPIASLQPSKRRDVGLLTAVERELSLPGPFRLRLLQGCCELPVIQLAASLNRRASHLDEFHPDRHSTA